MTSYLHNLRMQDKYTAPLSDYDIARAFPECRDIARRHLDQLTIKLEPVRKWCLFDPLAVYFANTFPDVKHYNRLKRYLKLTEPTKYDNQPLDTVRANQTPIISLYDFKKQIKTGHRIKALCPFHSDSNQSFIIYPNNTYFCFGCHASGDAISFLQRIRDISFPDAVKQLMTR